VALNMENAIGMSCGCTSAGGSATDARQLHSAHMRLPYFQVDRAAAH
jgi:hypothetical protein